MQAVTRPINDYLPIATSDAMISSVLYQCTITRGHPYTLAVPVVRSDHANIFFSSRVLKNWNSLPISVDNASLHSFRRSVRFLKLSCVSDSFIDLGLAF